jgi:hypothetical protein
MANNNNVIQLFRKRKIVGAGSWSKISAPQYGLGTNTFAMKFNHGYAGNDNCADLSVKRNIEAWNELMQNLKDMTSLIDK